MAIGQYHTVIADLGRPAVPGTAVYRYKFPDGRIIAYFHRRLFPIEFQVLRGRRYHGAGINAAILADTCALHDGDITADPGPLANLHVLMDHRERVDLYAHA